MIGRPPPVGIELEIRIRARPEIVFAYFTDGVRFRRWMGDTVDLDSRPGGRYRIQIPGRPTAEGTYLVVEPPERIVFSWGWVDSDEVPPRSTVVEIRLTGDGDHTVVHLAHRGLPSEASGAEHAAGWRHYLARLAVGAIGGDPGPDPEARTKESG